MNTGINLSTSPYITLLNDDVEFISKRWWDGVMECFKQFQNAWVVNPSSLADRNEEPRIPYKESYTDEEYQSLIDNASFEAIDGICMWGTVVPLWVFHKIGLLDEKFYPGGGEDYDFNARVYKEGGRCLGTSKSWLWHWWGKSKDQIEEADKQGLGIDKGKNWNSCNELWPEGFDIYNPKGSRNPHIHIDPL